MKKIYIFGIIFVVALIIVGIFRSPDDKNQEKKEAPAIVYDLETAVLEPKSNDEGGVTITVAPLGLSDEVWGFETVLSTHSVELNEDLTKVVVLVDENGKEYKPIIWEGSPPGGHHREGVLRFNALSSSPKSVKLIIRQIGGIEERVFEWPVFQ